MVDMAHIARQAQGKLRRLVLTNVNKREAESRMAHRQGECDRCGECCKILFQCPFLTSNEEGEHRCRIYGVRFNSCRFYPMQPEDLKEVDHCSYTFSSEAERKATANADADN